MTDELKLAPEGRTVVTSGTTEKTVNDQSDSYPQDFVKKVLTEKKNTAEKNQALLTELDELKKKLKDREEQELKEQNRWKELFEAKSKEVEDWRTKFTSQGRLIEDGLKASSLKKEFRKLGIKEDYLDKAIKLVDFGTIKVDLETKSVLGSEDQARIVAEEWKDLFGQKNVSASHAAPVGQIGALTLETWKRLPLEEKRKRQAEFFEANGIKLKP